MSKSKDKRVRKLKKMRIWPSILGLVLITVIFTFIFVLTVIFSSFDIIQRKLIDGLNQSIRISNIYNDYGSSDETKQTNTNNTVLDYLKLTQGVNAVCLKDSQGNNIWSSTGSYPDSQLATELDISEFNVLAKESSIIKLIVEEDKYNIFTYENQSLEVSDDIPNIVLDPDKLFNVNTFLSHDEKDSLLTLKLWYIIPNNNLEVYVLNTICVYPNDLLLVEICIALFAFILVVFILYYIISFISIIVNMRKTNQIIYTDMITGGDNWLHFVKKGTNLLKQRRKNKLNYAMLHLKMRKYRSFCTCLGVREGEELIERFYNILKKQITSKEAMAHHENAEFGLLISYTDKAQLEARIHDITHSLDMVLPNMKLYFATGIYLVEAADSDVDQLYNNALIACEMMGEDTENSIAYFDVEMNKQQLWERKVEDDMDRALANHEFKVYLQPKISTTEEKLAGAEALVRWIHPTDGFIPPNKFIPIFEKNGFILKLDDYMLDEIARQQAQWLREGRNIVPISVNISRAHFTREDLAEHICSIVDRYQVPHNVIELELTESAFFDDKNVLLTTVNKLRTYGFVVSMDDFGAGYSSLNSLKELPIDVLKIDADFFRGSDSTERGLLIVSEVIGLAKKLNMKIVAEGIESREQVDFLVEQECDLIQGYFYAKPMSIDEFVTKY